METIGTDYLSQRANAVAKPARPSEHKDLNDYQNYSLGFLAMIYPRAPSWALNSNFV